MFPKILLFVLALPACQGDRQQKVVQTEAVGPRFCLHQRLVPRRGVILVQSELQLCEVPAAGEGL